MDIAELRSDTPGLRNRVHLNSAGASLMPTPVIDAVVDHIRLESEIGGYEAADDASDAIGQAYEDVAALLGTSSDRIAMSEHATASFVAALSAIPFERGDLVVTTRNDYVSNQIQYLSLAHRFGVEVVRVPDAPEGGVDLNAMEETIHRRRPRLVAVTHIPTNSGLVQDVDSIGTMCRTRDVLYLVDGCQSVGQMPVDVERIGCDFFSATSRKYLRGPRGAGFLYVSDRVLDSDMEPLFPDLRGADWIGDDLYQPAPDARRFETWEFAWALVLGTGAAARYANELGLVPIRDRVRSLAATLRGSLSELPKARVLDRGDELGATVTASFLGHDPASLVKQLRVRGINTSSQSRLDAVIDYDDKGVDGALRMSPHYFNTESDLEALIEALRDIVRA
ncbi:MAG: aminotransferase class V-fold PLP-dependent enzyme [Gemmatimonadota bacterium]|nr:aminotransferase class V-fold PLP-dependent enzyme [Gemmatimonadota bacterium]